MYAPEYEQHAAHLGSGMDEHEQGKQSYIPKARVLAIVFARARIRLRGVSVQALAIRELQHNNIEDNDLIKLVLRAQ